MSVPSDKLALMGLYGQFRQATQDEWHGPCPRCGGKDRLVVHAVNPWPSWLWMCRQCSPEWKWADMLNPNLKIPLTDQQRADMDRQRKEREQAEAEKLRRKLADFTTHELWRELNRRMGEEQRHWWRNQGITDEWQDYLQLGWTPGKTISYQDTLVTTPAYTIPYLRQDGSAVTMQYRLENPPAENDKYRFEAGLPSAYYLVEHDQPIGDEVIICEGAKKSIVTKAYADPKATVLGVPGKNSWGGVVQAVKDCGRVWIILDPDGEKEALKLAGEIGLSKSRVVLLPRKIDDALLSSMSKGDLAQYFRHSRRLA